MKNAQNPWCFVLHVNRDTDLDEAWQILQEGGLNPLYMEEDPEKLSKIYIDAPLDQTMETLLDRFAFIEYVDQEELGKIDWQGQWAAHGLNFHDGHVHIDVPDAVSPAWKQLKLMPGAGFGDLSHPTTRLVLKMMQGYVSDKYVVDIGCGSGILALCAAALGAKHVYAIDIDEQALIHSQENAALNGMESKLSFYLPENFQFAFDEPPVILMNMIMSEQQQAWNSLKLSRLQEGVCIVSGILTEQKQAYLNWISEKGWKLCEEQQEQEWLGLRLQKQK